MKKLFMLLLILFAAYFGIQFAFKVFDKGHQVTYNLTGESPITVKETFTQNKKGEHDSYLFEVNTGSQLFYFQTYQSFGKAEQIITDLKTWKQDGYECIYPVTRGQKQITNVLCIKNGVMESYDHLKGQNANLDQFVQSLVEVNYQASNYEMNSESISEGTITYFPGLYQKKHYVGLETYRGVDILSTEKLRPFVEERLFEKDIYKRPLSLFAENYYVTANYEEEFHFTNFLVLNLKTGETFTIKSSQQLSYDAYFQGVIENNVYFYDRSTKKQYEIALKKKTCIEIGNIDLGIKVYENGSFIVRDAYDAYNKTLKFDAYSISKIWNGTTYERIDKTGKEITGYYYWYVKVHDHYDVYRSNVAFPEQRMYLFSTSRIDQMIYVDDYIYFLNGTSIGYYHDLYGLKTVANNSEWEFNTELKIGAF